MNLFTEIAILFTGMTAPVIVCLVVGLIFVIIELFQPGFGIFGIIGGILLLAAIVLRVLVGDGNIVAQIFLMLFFMTIILLIAFVIMVAMSKKGWLTKTPFYQKQTAVGIDRSEGTEDYTHLIGKDGVATTDLRPIGKAEIDGRIYDVSSDAFYLDRGEKIRVIAVDGLKIVVKKADEPQARPITE